MKKIKIMKLTPEEGIKEIEIENTLESLQNEVEGYIEFINIDSEHALIVNEEGKCLSLKNYSKTLEYLVGNVLFVRTRNGNVVSLKDSEIEALRDNIILNMFRIFNVN